MSLDDEPPRAAGAGRRPLVPSLDAEPPRAAGTGRRPLLKSSPPRRRVAAARRGAGPSEYPLWLALPVAPYSRRKTIRRDLGRGVWTFDQMIGIYYVHVPIRMTVVKLRRGGLFVYAPVAATDECLALLKELTDAHGPVKHIVLPSVAVEHKVLAGPRAAKGDSTSLQHHPRGDSAAAAWVSRVSTWAFDRVVPQHLDAPVDVGPAGFAATFANVGNTRFCDEDVAFLKVAEEGPLKFSVYPSTLTPLRGRGKCDLNEGLFT
ncbi:DUF4336-containing protein [Aureococcus anophagefferens]|nr:DUF4336-containing protein [Aureococcus anophagefferens]